jgi:superfamily II DNA or RNA helicase
MTSYLGTKGYTLYKNSLSAKELKEIIKELTVKPYIPKTIVKVTPFPLYRESQQKIYLPRYYGIDKYGMIETENSQRNKITAGADICLDFKGSLRAYQINIVNKYVAAVGKQGGGLLEVDTGLGKTVIALNIISCLKKKTLIIVHKDFLLQQWIERIEEFLPDARVGKIQGPIVDIEDKDIVIAMLQSLSMKSYPVSTFESFGFSIIDEVHHLGAEVFSQAFFKVVTNYALGLSATMERKDGLTKVFKMFIGRIVHTEKRDTSDAKVLVKAIDYVTQDEEFNEIKYDFRGNPAYSSMIVKLCQYNRRSEFILDVCEGLRKENPAQQIMILAHNKSLLGYLYDGIEHRKIGTVGYYVGGMKQTELKLSEGKEIIVATYAMASEGLDIKTLATLIMATPKTDIVQTVGRILRMPHKQPIVVDIIDKHELFRRQFYQRKRFYVKQNYKIIRSSNENFYNNKWNTIHDVGKRCNIDEEDPAKDTGLKKCMIKL